ncbi:transporter substrate-binding domain-containing protein [Candidatus Acetothermia bacterium]|nr:transporter substrate-binding domain-containing protein [Candidatus Acetothermia bacterium]MBI3643771.1 transporter substrate-binding domain-containing protein [Candidatus Acetothermia bacterium]
MYINRKILVLALVAVMGLLASGVLFASDSKLAASSTLEQILQRGKIQVGSDYPFEPFEFQDNAGKLVGLDVDLIKQLAKNMSVDYEFIATPFDTIISTLNNGNFDVIASDITATLGRALTANFTEAYIRTGQIVMVSTTKSPGKNVANYTDLNAAGVIITVQLGTTGEAAARTFFPKADIRTFDSADLAFLEVSGGRADAIVFDDVFLRPKAGTAGVDLCCPRGNPDNLTKEPISLAVRKGDPDFLTYLNLYIREAGSDIVVTNDLATEYGLPASTVGKTFLDAIKSKWIDKVTQ